MPPYVILQFSILLAIAGFVVYWKFETSSRFERHRQAEEQSLRAMRGIQATTLTLKTEVEELREICRDLAARPIPSSSVGMPAAKRSQAIRMLRRGESPENIAAALRLPRSHVQMLEKLRALSLADMPLPVQLAPERARSAPAGVKAVARPVEPAEPDSSALPKTPPKRRIWATA
ncbi:hypothetical protein F183_A43570 [Bryobacterales bacterium F-183]|nr:hypothetical protein F183_A43570 [Bryobacterales bacterium F-183]